MSRAANTDAEIRAAYSSDASGLTLIPDSVARPESAEEVSETLARATADKTSVTPAGGQTSTTGASITDSGTLLSTRGLARIIDIDTSALTMRVESGVLVGDLKRAAAAEGLLFPPDPTSEDESTIGGAIACNASGARSLKYGATRPHIRALKVALASGEIVELRRSALEKNTVGYAFAQDAMDWFIGSEGTLGVVIEAELGLVPIPEEVIGIAFPFINEATAIGFVSAARGSSSVDPRCLEYFDDLAFAIAREADDQPDWAGDRSALVYVEEEMTGDTESVLDRWLDLAQQFNSGDDARVFQGEAQLRHARKMRHNVPATMNERGARYRADGGRKVSTDWAVPYPRLEEMLVLARKVTRDAGLEPAVIYGHAGNGHPHQNFIARDASELAAIEDVVGKILGSVLAAGGTVAAEHGIGKLKRKWAGLQMSPLQIGVMRAVKRELDPLYLLAPDNIF